MLSVERMAIAIVSSWWHLMDDMKWNMRVIWIYCCHVGRYIAHAIPAFLLSLSLLFWHQEKNKWDKKRRRDRRSKVTSKYRFMNRSNCEPIKISFDIPPRATNRFTGAVLPYFYENLRKISSVPGHRERTMWRNVLGRILHSVLVFQEIGSGHWMLK